MDISVATSVNELMASLEEGSTTSTVVNHEFSETRGNNKIGKCLITIFPPDTSTHYIKPTSYFDESFFLNWWAQFEICPETQRLHAHIYCEFKNSNRPRYNTLKELIKTVTGSYGDIKVPKRTSIRQRACAVNYVLKDKDRAPETEKFIWEKNQVDLDFNENLANKKSKKQQSTEAIIAYIESKPIEWTWDQIVHENLESKILLATCSWGMKFHQGRHASSTRRVIQNVIVLYGAGGTGKTTMAYNYGKLEAESDSCRYYKRNNDDGKFWGGGRTAYKNQRVIHLEEFCGQETAANFKEICDIGKTGPSVNIKNGGTELNHETVIITSNHHPAGWYRKMWREDPKQWNPIVRRFTQVWFFPEKRDDGELNIPDENNLPYYIDQTDLFKDLEFQRNYDQAVKHAMDVWPMGEDYQGYFPDL